MQKRDAAVVTAYTKYEYDSYLGISEGLQITLCGPGAWISNERVLNSVLQVLNFDDL
jgi:hypothetical protein